MKTRILSIFLSIAIVVTSIAVPFQQAHAFNLFRAIKKTVRFVVTLPDRSTRWMGPVLGPAASFMLTKNIFKNPKISKIFKTAQKTNRVIQDIEEVNKQVNELKNAYTTEAKNLRKKADELEEIRKSMASGLLEGKDFQEYLGEVADIQKIIEAHRAAADQLDKQAAGMNRDKFISMLGNKFVKNTLEDIKNIIFTEVASDLLRTTDPNLIRTFVESDGSFDSVIDYMIDRELGNVEAGDMNKDELRDRIRSAVKDKVRENSDFLKDNWKEELTALIQDQYDQMQSEVKDLPSGSSAPTSAPSSTTKEQQDQLDDFDELLDDLSSELGSDDIKDCKPGYKFQARSGVGCIQINCNEVDPASHYSYTGACICGSSGSMNEDPKDPNKECSFPSSYESCPSCLYACVHLDEDCPLDGIGL